MIVGALYFAYGVTHIVNIVEELNQPERVFAQQLDKYNQYMQYRNLSKQLKIDIREYLTNTHRRREIGEAHEVCMCVVCLLFSTSCSHADPKPACRQSEGALLQHFSKGLRSRVASEVYTKILEDMPFFIGLRT